MEKLFSGLGSKIFNTKGKKNIYNLSLILLVGILIRLLLMPFFAHSDLIKHYAWAYKLISEGRVYPGPFGFLWLTTHGFFIKLFSWALPRLEEVLVTDQAINPLYNLVYSSPWISRTLFVLKIPFLILDVGCGLLLLKLLRNKRGELLAFSFWMLNPITIFTFYLHGKDEFLPLFFLLLSFLFWRKKATFVSFLSLGLSITLRLFPLLFLPVFIFKLKERLVGKIKYLIIALLPLAVDIILKAKLADRSFTPATKLYSPSVVFMTANIETGLGRKASLLLAIWVFFYLWLGFERKIKKNWQSLVDLSCLSLLPWFGLGFIHPQYFCWLVLFFGLLIVKDLRYLFIYFLILISWLMIVLDYGKALGLGLLSPLNNFVFSNHAASFRTLFYLYFPEYNLTHLGRSLLLGTLLFLSYCLLQKLFRKPVFKGE